MMLERTRVSPCLLFGSFLYHQDFHQEADLKQIWEDKFGPSFYLSPRFNPLAKYYSSEMGSEEKLKRFFALTHDTFSRDKLLISKFEALAWERSMSRDKKRTVNVDTGMLTAENFTLATTKNYSHRIFIGENIFSDLTYQFQHGKFQSLPWTYPDYLDEEKVEFFTWGRSYLLTLSTHSKT